MAILPLFAAVTVLLNGSPVLSYAPAYVVSGRTYAPLAPYVTGVADRIAYRGKRLVISRGMRRTTIALLPVAPSALDREYVEIAPILRALGESVRYDRTDGVVEVRSAAPAPVALPLPFDPLAAQQPPRVVFTPAPAPTPRPVWRGPAVPRRTPLPYPLPT